MIIPAINTLIILDIRTISDYFRKVFFHLTNVYHDICLALVRGRESHRHRLIKVIDYICIKPRIARVVAGGRCVFNTIHEYSFYIRRERQEQGSYRLYHYISMYYKEKKERGLLSGLGFSARLSPSRRVRPFGPFAYWQLINVRSHFVANGQGIPAPRPGRSFASSD